MKQKRTRVRILYVILLILIGITVGPLWFYGSRMMSMNRERLETQESILQTITSAIAFPSHFALHGELESAVEGVL